MDVQTEIRRKLGLAISYKPPDGGIVVSASRWWITSQLRKRPFIISKVESALVSQKDYKKNKWCSLRPIEIVRDFLVLYK
uniref:Uncharacterized protein n=1 Tax=Megaselia scalaris TaxID=36166 RepID=T1GJD6_MEGSC